MPEPVRSRIARLLLALGGAALLAGTAGGALPPAGSGARAPGSFPHQPSIPLPKSIDGWTRADTVRLVRPDALFDYMDGGADLYLGYRLRQLEVCEYDRPAADPILLELYFMETSDDAYGLFSLEGSGQPVLADSSHARALEQGGLLRLWSDDLFARIMAYKESDASRQAVASLARAIAAGRPGPPPPALCAVFPRDAGADYRLLRREPAFFRGPVGLSTVAPLPPRDQLQLDAGCEGAAGGFLPAGSDSSASPVFLILLRYPDDRRCLQGMDRFRRSYLAETNRIDLALKRPPEEERGGLVKEGRWSGFSRFGRNLALVLAAPEEKTGRRFLADGEAALKRIGSR